MSLEPRNFQAGTMLYGHGDHIYEMIFMMKGSYEVGYIINNSKKRFFKFNMTNKVIGGFNCTFCKKNYLSYYTKTGIQGMMIRRRKIQSIKENSPELFREIEKTIFRLYVDIRKPIRNS